MKITKDQQLEIRKALAAGYTPNEVAELLGISVKFVYHHRKALVTSKILPPLRKAAKKPVVKEKNISDTIAADVKQKNKVEVRKRAWTFTVIDYSDGSSKLTRVNDGFEIVELIGMASFTVQDLTNILLGRVDVNEFKDK